MKSRLALLFLAAVLLVALVAPSASHAASLVSTSQAPLCAANSSVSALPFLNPVVPKIRFPQQTCGSCSEAICRGAADFSQCGVAPSGQLMHCNDNGTCPADGLLSCVCVVYAF